MRRRRVCDVIDPGIPTVRGDTTVREAAELITNFQLEGCPVVAAGGALLGLIKPTELIRLLADPPDGGTSLMAPPAEER